MTTDTTEEMEVLIIEIFKMIKLKKCKLFRNDFFGIKEKMFMWRITNSIKKRNNLLTNQLECLLNISMYIGIPRTEDEAIKLEWIYDTYKSLASEIESDMKRVCDKIYDWRND